MFSTTTRILHAREEHSESIHQIIRLAYGLEAEDECPDCMTPDNISALIGRFPQGQFVALEGEKVVGFALTMRTNNSPYDTPLTWWQQVGDRNITNHEPVGSWLYGVEFAVHPDYQRRGIGTALYKARFMLVKALQLRGFYAGGMLSGYPRYKTQLSLQEYAQKVINGEIKDPTVSMQMHQGFRPYGLIENYAGAATVCDNAMLIVWTNPQLEAMPVVL